MRVEFDPAAAQAFMTALVKIERDGVPLTLATALVALDINPWSFAGELAVARRSQARARLRTVLRKLGEDGPEIETIAPKPLHRSRSPWSRAPTSPLSSAWPLGTVSLRIVFSARSRSLR